MNDTKARRLRDLPAARRLATKYDPLVGWCVKKFIGLSGRDPDYPDAVQDGRLALWWASRLWRADRGVTFKTYATRAVRNALFRWLEIHSRHGFTYVGDSAKVKTAAERPASTDTRLHGNPEVPTIGESIVGPSIDPADYLERVDEAATEVLLKRLRGRLGNDDRRALRVYSEAGYAGVIRALGYGPTSAKTAVQKALDRWRALAEVA